MLLVSIAGFGLFVQRFAYENAATRGLAIFCATQLIFLLCGVWLVVVLAHRSMVSAGSVTRVIGLMLLSYAAARTLGHFIFDPRPYLVEDIRPLTSVSADNGFPSDHVLLAAALTASLWWIQPRLVPWFALAAAVVMLGRLGIAAHHTIDVFGSVGIVSAVSVIVTLLPLPRRWSQPVPFLMRRSGGERETSAGKRPPA